jgi:hypothetical protein
MKDELQKAYDERHVRWSEEYRKQFSFLNNLLLTIGIALLTVLFKDKDFSNIHLSLKNINCDLTLSVLALIAITLSVVFGIITAFNRLWDFRITSRITLIRKRMYKHANVKLDESSSEKSNLLQMLTMYWQLLIVTYPNISIEQCKNFERSSKKKKQELQSNFKRLRSISFNLGRRSWRNFKFQIITLMMSLIFLASAVFF